MTPNRTRRQWEREPFAGLDRTGMPPLDELARIERTGLLSMMPSRRPWADAEPPALGGPRGLRRPDRLAERAAR